MSKAKRVTERHMRVGKNGPTTAAHIDKRNEAPELQNQVRVSACFDFTGRLCEGAADLEAHEQAVYEAYFSDALEAANAKHRKARNHKRIKTMEAYRRSPKTCPEDTLYYIGEKGNTATPKQLLDAYLDHLEWRRKTFPRVKVLGMALHVENGAPHIEEHAIWTSMTDGKWVINQEQALRDMGIERPDPSKPVGRYNNAKMTYTKLCRDHWIETAKSYGFEIVEEPRERGKSGRSLDEFQTEREREKRDALIREQHDLRAEIDDMRDYMAYKAQKVAEAEREAEEARQRAEAAEREKRAAEAAREAARRAEEARQREQAAQEARRAKEATRRAEEAPQKPRERSREEMYQEARQAIYSPQRPLMDKVRQRAAENDKREQESLSAEEAAKLLGL